MWCCSLALTARPGSSRSFGTTHTPNGGRMLKVAPMMPSVAKALVLTLLGLLGVLYLSGYFFLWSLKLSPYQARPLTIPKYTYYYWQRPAVRSRIEWSSASALLLVGGFVGLLLIPRRRSLHGDARWATARTIKQQGLFSDHGILLGRYGKRYLTFPGQTAVILASPPPPRKRVSFLYLNH